MQEDLTKNIYGLVMVMEPKLVDFLCGVILVASAPKTLDNLPIKPLNSKPFPAMTTIVYLSERNFFKQELTQGRVRIKCRGRFA